MSSNPDTDRDRALEKLADCLRNRRTVKQFLPEPVSRQLVMDAIEVARWAPNHHLTEPWHFYLMGETAQAQSVELIREIITERKGAELGEFKARHAATQPGWLAVTCSRSGDAKTEQEDYASVACAIQNLSLYLFEAGVASKWSTGPIISDPRFYEILGVDADEAFVVGLIWFGYPKIMPTQKRKAVANIATELA